MQTYSQDRLYIDSSGNVGIGTASPSQKLHVNGNIRVGNTYFVDSAYSFPSNAAGFGSDGYSAGVRGDQFTVGKRDGVNYAPVYAQSFVNMSDIRFKKDIKPLGPTLEKLDAMHGISFVWKNSSASSSEEGSVSPQRNIGVVAQEIELLFPELVTTDARGVKLVNYDGLTVVLLEAVKELKAKNDELKARIDALEPR